MDKELLCDFCHEPMDQQETGMFLLDQAKGGHIACAREALANG